MFRKSFGLRAQVRFEDVHQFYRCLGYLAKSNGSTALTWENNEDQGAWGSEGRIMIYTRTLPINIGSFSLTRGTGNALHRVNCNAFVEMLNEDYGFVMGKYQNPSLIRSRIPSSYQVDFDEGLSL